MASIINRADVLTYSYVVNGTDKVITPGPWDDVTNPYVNQDVEFSKECTPAFADYGDMITITYRIKNNDKQALTPIINTITIQDPFLAIEDDNFHILSSNNVIGLVTPGGDTFTVDLTDVGGSLNPGEEITATINYRIDKGFDFTKIVSSMATATFVLASGATTIPAQTDVCQTGIQNGTLELDKDSNPAPNTTVSVGTTIIYTITITNVGNVPSTIPVGGFLDYVPTKTTFQNITQGDPYIVHYDADLTGPSRIQNALPIVIQGNNGVFTIVYSVITDNQL